MAANVDQKYKKHELRDHIYQIPDTYIGSVESTQLETFLFDDETKRMVKKTITYVPGLYKIFDEVIVNATDHAMRLAADMKAKKEGVIPMKVIKVNIDKETGYIEVMNDGDGIDVEEHPTYHVPVPQLIFGELLTSTNYDPGEEKLWGGKNGYGAKLTNIFSKEFTIETIDHRRKKVYVQSFHNNMKSFDKPSIKASSKAPFTKIRFLPDYARFGMRKLSDDMYDLFRKRAMDACATTDASIAIHFNGEKLDIKSFEKYTELYIGKKDERARASETCGDRWEVVATYSENGQFDQVSFVNGILTNRGGKHVEYITNQITKRLAEMATAKTKKTVKPQYIKDNLMVFIKSLIVNPSFDTQTKDSLTTQVAKFGSKCELSDKFFASLYKTGITEKALSLTEFHDTKKLAKTDGKKTNRIMVPKLDDANWAGTKKSSECTLILTEGDSARTMAISGLSVVGRDKYGVFPLRGKILNVKDAEAEKIMNNAEISNLKKILGLQHGKEYKDLADLRYGSIMIMCDSDVDGSHIKGLLFNVFQSIWPSLYKQDGFLTAMLTPIIKVTNAKKESIKFYTQTDFENWKKVLEQSPEGARGWKIKYYKGLGTSSEEEAKDYFRDMKRVTYTYDKDADEAIDLAFNKKRSDDRKEWLMKYNRQEILDYTKTHVPYEQFVHKELIHFSNRDLERSINHMCDGLKESTRKILFGCMKRRLYRDEIKVAQLAAYIAEVSAYHHGEASLQQAIIGMGQNFVGTNNINLLSPNGQFGTRVMGGEDAASPRYIFTVLTQLAKLIFREEDNPTLNYLEDDGIMVEPEYYIPIVPLILINGGLGIGTGFSTNVPCHNPEDILKLCEKIIATIDKDVPFIETKEHVRLAASAIDKMKLSSIQPWYLGFTGDIAASKEKAFVSKGVYKWLDDTTIEITELPLFEWTDNYKEKVLTPLVEDGSVLKNFDSHYTAKTVRFLLNLQPGAKAKFDKDPAKFEALFKLSSSKNLSLNNIHLYGTNGAVRKYKDTMEVLKDWAGVRIEKYLERKLHQLKSMEHDHKIVSAKVRFIQDIIEGYVIVNNKKLAEVEEQLRKRKYPTSNDGEDGSTADGAANYNYLTRMPIYQLTYEKKKALEKEAHDLKMAIDALRAKPIQKIWHEELQEFKDAWEAHKSAIEEEYAADRENKPVAGAKKRAAAKKK